LLDRSHATDEHALALKAQQDKVADPALTPSAQVLASMAQHKESFAEFSLRQSQVHAEFFHGKALSVEEQSHFETLARESLAEQSTLEQNEVGDFDLFVGSYQASILAISH
jgi:glutamate--cysteine ligase